MPWRPDKYLVSDFLTNAGRIFETAASANGAELEAGGLAILIGQDGAIHMLMNSDWPVDSLQAHHGASAAYRVSRSGGQIRVEGKSRTGSCLLQSEPAAAVAKRFLADRPRYLLAARSLQVISSVARNEATSSLKTRTSSLMAAGVSRRSKA